jgi:ribonuclease T2
MKRFANGVVAVAVLLLSLSCASVEARHSLKDGNTASGTPGVFDFYVLSLSWSPEHCADVPSDTSTQCSQGSGLGFVLHGLWPQYQTGWPHNCTSEALPGNAWGQFPDVFPSPGLMQHEWTTHGTCSGLSVTDYITLAKNIKNSVNIPSTYQQPTSIMMSTQNSLIVAFASANPNLATGSIQAVCGGKQHAWLQEVHICVDKTGNSIACSDDEVNSAVKSCTNGAFKVLGVN